MLPDTTPSRNINFPSIEIFRGLLTNFFEPNIYFLLTDLKCNECLTSRRTVFRYLRCQKDTLENNQTFRLQEVHLVHRVYWLPSYSSC